MRIVGRSDLLPEYQGVLIGSDPTIMLWPRGHYKVMIGDKIYDWTLDHFSDDLSTVIWQAPDGVHASKLADYEKTWRVKTT